jgi:sugar phosphate isomerase/epimerase
MRRREFLKSSASFSGAMLFGAGGRTFGQTPRTIRVGLQLYSVRKSLAKDPWGTLREVARAGYHYLEAANHQARTDPGVGFGVKAPELKERLSDLGLSIVGCHINPLDIDIIPRALDYQVALGNKQIGNDIEFYPYGDMDHVLQRCELFNKIGDLAKQRGMRFYYHNHFQEFQKFGDKFVYEIIAEKTDPSLIFFEMDTYWMYRGGQNPLDWMKRLKERIVLLHQKDFPSTCPQPMNLYEGVIDGSKNIDLELFMKNKHPLCFTEIGTGILPIQSIIDAANNLPRFEYMLLEQDLTQMSELDSIRTSKKAFTSKFHNVSF